LTVVADVDPLLGSFCSLAWKTARSSFSHVRLPVCTTARFCFSTSAACWRIDDVSQGTIKKLTDKGFGFIEGERGDIFFHSSSVVGTGYDSLYEGQAVSYNEGQGPKGKRAENVQPVA
jgi:CspA family cold shock protein